MANSELKTNTYEVPPILQKFMGSTISYANMKMTKTRLTQAKEAKNFEEYKQKGGDEVVKWIEETLKTARDSVYNVKKTGMDAGRENEFLKTHEKDKDNANPTQVGGLPKINKGNISRKIMTNKEVYNESINVELQQIRYLMEYMSIKKTKL